MKEMNRKTGLMALCVCSISYGLIWAQAPQRRESPQRRAGGSAQRFGGGFMSSDLIRALDPNRDGRISPAEIKGATSALQALDRNRDGVLSFDELGISPKRGFSGGRPGGFSRGGGGFRSGASRVSRSGLSVGSALPDVKIFDEQGKPFDLKQLRGGHTVIVFGCLT